MPPRDAIAVGSASEMARLLKPFAGGELAAPHQVEWLLPGSDGRGGVFRERAHPSEFVRERSEPGERPGELYARMVRSDTDLAGLLEKRRKAVLALPRYLRPRDSSPQAREVAGFVRQGLAVVPQRVINLAHLLDAIPKGVAMEELIWEEIPRGPLAGAWLPVDVIDRPMHRFAFEAHSGRLHVRRRSGLPVPAPPGKFLVHTHGTKDTPWGAALLDHVYWYWFLKKHAAKYWAVFVERFAQPLVVGKYKHRNGDDPQAVAYNEEQQRQLLAAIEAIRTGTGLALPEGLLLEFLEASRSGDASYQSFCGWLTRSMALVVLGEIDTSGLAKGPGSFAKSEVSNEVRIETLKHDAGILGTFETDTLLRWIVWANYGPDAPVPHSVYDSIDATDREQRRLGIEAGLKAGQPVSVSYFRMTHQLPELVEGEDIVEPATPFPSSVPPLSVPPSVPVRLTATDLADLGERIEARETHFAAITDAFLPLTLRHFQAHRDRVLALWDAGAARDGSLLTRLVDRAALRAHAERLEAAQIHAMGFALLFLREDLAVPAPRLAEPGDFAQWTTPLTAIEFWSRLLGVSTSAFRAFQDPGRRLAHATAGLTEGALLADLHPLLGRALAEGMDRAAFVQALDALYARHGLTPTASHHAEVIYANHVHHAANAVRWAQTVGNPAVHARIPYLFWWTASDDRVRHRPLHNHAVMHGYIAAVTHEIWRTWWTPAGHNCRCGIGTISLAEARRRGLTGAEPSGPWPLADGTRALPDPGFRSAPDLGAVAVAVEAKLERIVEEARSAGADLLVEALSLLFSNLFPQEPPAPPSPSSVPASVSPSVPVSLTAQEPPHAA
jgi:phage gp29-like protein